MLSHLVNLLQSLQPAPPHPRLWLGSLTGQRYLAEVRIRNPDEASGFAAGKPSQDLFGGWRKKPLSQGLELGA
jgi:hypothetical protein